MFDWDSDYESVIDGQPDALAELLPAAVLAAPTPSILSRLRGVAGRSLMGVAVVAGLAVAGSVQMQGGPVLQEMRTLMALPMQMLGWDDSVMPEGLLAYDQAQYDNFRYGIAGFSDSELLAYARETQAMVAGDGLLAAYSRDALLLTYREMNRRGLDQIVILSRVAYPQM